MDAGGEWLRLTCPYCGEALEIVLDPLETGSLVEDCSVCCSPCQLTIDRDEWGDPLVTIERAE